MCRTGTTEPCCALAVPHPLPIHRFRRDMKRVRDTASQSTDQLRQQIEELEETVEDLQTRTADLQAAREELRQENRRLRQELTRFQFVDSFPHRNEEGAETLPQPPETIVNLYGSLPPTFSFQSFFQAADGLGFNMGKTRRALRYLLRTDLVRQEGSKMTKQKKAETIVGTADTR